jgi:hypothetical protein
LGWQRVGVIPGYALMPGGGLCSTTVLYRDLGGPAFGGDPTEGRHGDEDASPQLSFAPCRELGPEDSTARLV